MNKGTKKAKGEPKSHRKAAVAKPSGGSLFILFAVIAASSALFVSLIYLINRPAPPPVKYADLPQEMLPRGVMEHPEFFHWFTAWKKVDGYLRVQEFTLVSEAEFNWSGLEAASNVDGQESPASSRYVWSQDGKRYVDFLADYGSERPKVLLGSAEERGELFSRAALGGFHDAFWLDDDRFVVVGVRPELRADGSRLCLSDGENEKCFDRLTLDVVDVAAGRVKSFESEKHYLASNPYDVQNRLDWLDSLTGLEKAKAGVAGEVVYKDKTGVIDSVEPPGIVRLTIDDETKEYVLADRVQILDDNGQAVSLGFLRRGLKVKAVVIASDDGEWQVVQRITVTEAPSVLLYSPKDGDKVSALNILGAVRMDVDELTIRVTNQRTSERFVNDVISLKHEGSDWQEFGTTVDLADDCRAGDELSVAVFDANNPDVGYTVNVEYEAGSTGSGE